VTFNSNGKTISGCSAVMVTSSRTAACTTTSLTAGTDTIKASYSGNSDYPGSSGSVTQTVNKAASTATVISSKSPFAM
jgi:Bacterial Ig-like domain (group 3)